MSLLSFFKIKLMCPYCLCSLASLNVKLLNTNVSIFPLCDDSPLECTTPQPECRAQWHLHFLSHPLQKPVSPESTPSPDPTGAYSSEGHCSVLELFIEIQSVNWGVLTEITGIVQPKISAFIYLNSCCYKPMWLPFCTGILKKNFEELY